MENRRRTFQVALPYKEYMQHAGVRWGDLPSIIREEDSDGFLKAHRNIFALDICHNVDITSLKSYEYVGGRDVKNYQQKNNPKKRRHFSNAKRST